MFKDWKFLDEYLTKLEEIYDGLLRHQDPQLQALGMRGLCAMATWINVISHENQTEKLNKVVDYGINAVSDKLK